MNPDEAAIVKAHDANLAVKMDYVSAETMGKREPYRIYVAEVFQAGVQGDGMISYSHWGMFPREIRNDWPVGSVDLMALWSYLDFHASIFPRRSARAESRRGVKAGVDWGQ